MAYLFLRRFKKLTFFVMLCVTMYILYLELQLQFKPMVPQRGIEIYRTRRESMLKTCQKEMMNHIMYSDDYIKNRIIISEDKRVAFCPIQKVASSFWKQTFRNHFGKRIALETLKDDEINYYLNKSLTFMFVRDPFSRLYSGYVDKIFAPNVPFWHITGKYAIGLTRPNASKTELRCGHDLSFREMVKYFIHSQKTGKKTNVHFTLQYSHCDQCRYKYDVIGKLETMEDDFLYLLKKVGEPGLFDQYLKEEKDTEKVFTDQIGWLYEFRKGYKDCLSFYAAQKRMWKKLQIRGYISKSSKYPVTEAESESLPKEKYHEYVMEAVGDAGIGSISKRNKQEAFLEAYSSVDKNDLEELSQILQPDCDFFGYDCRPPKIFDLKEMIQPWYFDVNTA